MKRSQLLKFIAVSLTASHILVACNKDNDALPLPDKVGKLLYNWKITDITTPKAGQPSIDSSIYKACMSDDVIKFMRDGFNFQDGTSICDSTLFSYSKGGWAYKTTTDSILLYSTSPGKYVSWKVITLSDSTLKVRYTDSAKLARKIEKTVSFKHS